MKKSIAILGSTGSIGSSTLNCVSGNNNFSIRLLSTNKNVKKLLMQSKKFKVRDAIVEDINQFYKYSKIFKKNKINLHHGLKNLKEILKDRVNYCINAISGLDGLHPTLNIIPHTENILIANKESIICGWELISNKLRKHNTEFIPIDSEHFSIWKLIKYENIEDINKIILTASGGPFLNIPNKKIINIKPKFALKHPNWKMGKKISIDSSTMMNKVFEYIEAKKIFNLKKNKLSILIHPSSFVHAIVFLKGDLIKFLAHETNMKIPISNALDIKNISNKNKFINHVNKINNLEFIIPDLKKFPLLSLLKLVPEDNSYFETVLITINDYLVNEYLDERINYISIQRNLIRLIKNPYFKNYYKLKPTSIYDIKKMTMITKKYLKNNIRSYAF